MSKRALCRVAAVVAVTALAFTVSPVSASVAGTQAPRDGKKALRILRADVMKIARDYSHKRYRSVCADLTKRQRERLGGTAQCMLKIAVINALLPIRKFTITGTRLGKRRINATVTLYINGNKRHRIRAVAKWEGGAYRLDRQSGWKPRL